MNSEKVKEIKECLQSCNDDKMACYDCKYYEKCEKILTKNNILTLINELESELKEEQISSFNCNTLLQLTEKENQQLKDRIAELEKEIKETPSYAKGYADGIKNTYEAMLTQKLENFAERLKEKYGKSCSEYYPVLIEMTSDDIDETLKEYEG